MNLSVGGLICDKFALPTTQYKSTQRGKSQLRTRGRRTIRLSALVTTLRPPAMVNYILVFVKMEGIMGNQLDLTLY